MRIFCVASAVFGNDGDESCCSPRRVNYVAYVTGITHKNPFAWKLQHLVILEWYFSPQVTYFG